MPRNRLLALTGVGLAALVGIFWAFANDDCPPVARIPARAPAIAIAPQPQPQPQPRAQPTAPQPDIFSQTRTGAIETSVSAATDSRRIASETVTRTPRKPRSEAPQPTAATPSRVKPRTTPARTAEPAGPVERVPPVVVTPDPVATKRRLEEGSDLTFMRRPTVKIDSESPYE
jgi:hypothetical protein